MTYLGVAPPKAAPTYQTRAKIWNNEYGVLNDDLDRRGLYLANHPERINRLEICGRMRHLDKIMYLEVQTARCQQIARKQELLERKMKARLNKLEALATLQLTKKKMINQAKFKLDQLKKEETNLKQMISKKKDEGRIREREEGVLKDKARVVEELKKEKHRTDMGVRMQKFRVRDKKRESSDEVDYYKALEHLTHVQMEEQMAEGDVMMEELKQVNHCLKLYHENLHKYSTMVDERICRSLTYKMEDIQHLMQSGGPGMAKK